MPAFGPPGSVEINNPTRAIIFSTPFKIKSSNRIPSVSVLELINGEYQTLGTINYDTLTSLNAVINVLSLDKSYILKTNTFGTDSYSKPFSFASSSFLSTIELSITDGDKIRTSISQDNVYSVSSKEVISRQLVALDTEDGLNLSGISYTDNNYSFVTERMTRTLSTLEGSDTQETVSSSIGSSGLSFSSIVEVKQFQYSSLG